MSSLYKNILSQSIKIVWRKKYLWFFGLFAVLLVGSDAEFQILSRFFTSNDINPLSSVQLIFENLFSWQALANMAVLLKNDPVSLIAGILILLIIALLMLFVFWLAIVSQTALVKNTANIIFNKTNNIQTGVESGIANFWPVFGLNILNKISIFLSAYIISLPIALNIFSRQPVMTNLAFVIIFLLIVPVALSISFLIKYSIAYTVVKGDKFIDSIKKGWELFVNNWLVSLELAITLFFISFLTTFAVSIIAIMLIQPFMILSSIAVFISHGLSVFINISYFLTIIVLVALSGSVLITFQISAWTGMFIELTNNGGTSKIVRMVSKILK